MAASVSSLYRRSADTITVSSFILTHPCALIVCRAANVLTRTTASDRHESWTRSSTSARFLNNVARNSLFGSALRDQKPHDFNTSPSKTEGTAGELRAKFWGRGSIGGWNEDQAGAWDNDLNRARPGQTWARSVTSASVSSTRSRGLSSTLRPRRPPETIMVSWSRHAESMNKRCEVVCPSGLMPPTT